MTNDPAAPPPSPEVAGEGSDQDEPQLVAAQLIRLATLIRRAASQRFRRMFDLSMLEWLIVVQLAAEPPSSLTTLARNASLDLQRTSLAVTRLAKRDLVHRRKNPQNAREAQIELTPRGRAIFNAIIENWLNKELVTGLTERELRATGDVLRRLLLKTEMLLEHDSKSYP